jgi:hypothetical protein
MSIIDELQRTIAAGQYRASEHARVEMKADELREPQVIAASLRGEVIEGYPTLCPCPACLLLGRLEDGSPLHVVWAFDGKTDYAVMVTAYRPDPERWSADFRKRVKR